MAATIKRPASHVMSGLSASTRSLRPARSVLVNAISPFRSKRNFWAIAPFEGSAQAWNAGQKGGTSSVAPFARFASWILLLPVDDGDGTLPLDVTFALPSPTPRLDLVAPLWRDRT